MNKFGQNTDQPAIYFNKLYMKNVRCFKGNHEIDLGNKKGEPSQWNVILGNNNVGKTTILRALAGFEIKNLKTKIDGEENNQFRGVEIFGLNTKYYSFEEDLLFIGGVLVKWSENTFNAYDSNSLIDKLKNSYLLSGPIGKTYKKGDLEWLKAIITSSYILAYKNLMSLQQGFHKKEFKIFGYGTTRIMQEVKTIQSSYNTQGLFDNKTLLSNVEEWLKELYFALTQQINGANIRYKQVENILCGGLLPDVTEIRITTIPDKSSFETFPEFLTSQGWVRLEDLGFGYQATLAWVADLAKRMFDQYPDLENPLHGPSVVLVDEIDLHLHPEWQRKIIKYLSDLFPNTQFIVTAHSPLIIQSAENVNLIMLEKDDNPDGKGINIRQRFGSFQGWTVDEILTELMNLGDRTRSDLYLQLMQDFENAVLDDDYEKAQSAYNQLDTILSPSSYQRKVLQIQMSSLIPVGV
jgi:energy-coupling factor transporter ATP-binding protein EcfA2